MEENIKEIGKKHLTCLLRCYDKLEKQYIHQIKDNFDYTLHPNTSLGKIKLVDDNNWFEIFNKNAICIECANYKCYSYYEYGIVIFYNDNELIIQTDTVILDGVDLYNLDEANLLEVLDNYSTKNTIPFEYKYIIAELHKNVDSKYYIFVNLGLSVYIANGEIYDMFVYKT